MLTVIEKERYFGKKLAYELNYAKHKIYINSVKKKTVKISH